MPVPRHFLLFFCLYLRIRLGRPNLVVGSNSVSATTSVLSIGARYPATIRFFIFRVVIAQKRANTTECCYSMSSSFFSPGSNTESRVAASNRIGQDNRILEVAPCKNRRPVD